jgi:translation initiation factor IF-1
MIATVLEALPNYNFKVLSEDGKEIRAYVSGKMRMNNIKIIVGDKVDVDLPQGSQIGRIKYRK